MSPVPARRLLEITINRFVKCSQGGKVLLLINLLKATSRHCRHDLRLPLGMEKHEGLGDCKVCASDTGKIVIAEIYSGLR